MLSYFKDKRVLITGHTGFKGSWLTLLLCELGAQVTGFALAPETTPNLFSLIGQNPPGRFHHWGYPRSVRAETGFPESQPGCPASGGATHWPRVLPATRLYV